MMCIAAAQVLVAAAPIALSVEEPTGSLVRAAETALAQHIAIVGKETGVDSANRRLVTLYLEEASEVADMELPLEALRVGEGLHPPDMGRTRAVRVSCPHRTDRKAVETRFCENSLDTEVTTSEGME